MRASQARTLLDTIAGNLGYVGVLPHLYQSIGSDQWDGFVNVARVATRRLVTGHWPRHGGCRLAERLLSEHHAAGRVRRVVGVDLGRGDVGVAHPFLDRSD